jgi:hypothetical protein
MTELDTGQVECYSGHTYAQEPRALVWQARRYAIVEIERRWRSPEGPAFWVGTETGDRFQLHYHETAHRWVIAPLGASKEAQRSAMSTVRPQTRLTSPTNIDNHLKDKEVQS